MDTTVQSLPVPPPGWLSQPQKNNAMTRARARVHTHTHTETDRQKIIHTHTVVAQFTNSVLFTVPDCKVNRVGTRSNIPITSTLNPTVKFDLVLVQFVL